VTGDEASLSLASGQLMAWSATKLYGYFARAKNLTFLTKPLRRMKIPKSFWFLPAISILAIAVGFHLPQDNPSVGAALILLVGKIGIGISVLALGGMTTTIFDNLLFGLAFIFLWMATLIGTSLIGTVPERKLVDSRIARWAVGLGSLLAVDYYTEATPLGGPWTVFHFSRHKEANADSELAHSIYHHPEVRSLLVEWLATARRA
jgi:hypothetical protein